jgi:hypothetical protein
VTTSFKKGDLVEIFGYGSGYDGTTGIFEEDYRNVTDRAVCYFRVTSNLQSYPKGSRGAMYAMNLRLVDQAHTFIPEVWS